MEIESDLKCVVTDPPKDRCGYFGIVLKPKWMPLWLARKLKYSIPIREGWLNMPSLKSDERWWFDKTDDDINNRVEPIYWCSIRSYYKVKVEFLGGNPFNCKISDPEGAYKVAK